LCTAPAVELIHQLLGRIKAPLPNAAGVSERERERLKADVYDDAELVLHFLAQPFDSTAFFHV
jgi:hypothetical protein